VLETVAFFEMETRQYDATALTKNNKLEEFHIKRPLGYEAFWPRPMWTPYQLLRAQ
jgi:hypothetical protein